MAKGTENQRKNSTRRAQTGSVRTGLAALLLGGSALAAYILAPEEFVSERPVHTSEQSAEDQTPRAENAPLAAIPFASLGEQEVEAAEKMLDEAWTALKDKIDKSQWPEGVTLPGLPGDDAGTLPFPPDGGPARELLAASFGETLSVSDAQTRWERIRAGHPELADFNTALVKSKLWAVWPVHDLVITGGEEAVLREVCADMSALGTPCEIVTISSESVSGYLVRHNAPEQVAPPEDFNTGQRQDRAAPKQALLSDLTEEGLGSARALRAAQREAPRVHYLGHTMPDGDSRTARVIAVGDVMPGSDYPSKAGLHPKLRQGGTAEDVLDPAMLDLIRGGDVAFLNLEGVLLDGGEPAKACTRCFVFRSPERYAGLLAEAGFDVASLANNHSGDFGVDGRAATVRALNAVGIAPTGLDAEGARTARLDLENGLSAGVVSFAPNGGVLSLHDTARAVALVEDLDAAHDIVIVSVHAGAEGPRASRVPKAPEIYLGEDRGDVHGFAHKMVKAGADLVLGHGPHVPRALEIVDDRLIAYSLGNFWTYTGFISWGLLGVGPVLDVTLAADGSVIDLTVHSTRQAGMGVPFLDSMGEARRFTLDRTRRDFPATYALLSRSHGPHVAALPFGAAPSHP